MSNNLSRAFTRGLIATGCAVALAGCFSSSSGSTPEETTKGFNVTAFAPGEVSASIRWADYGVPYITADSLEGIAFGTGYAYARDNACILADQIVRFNSQRSLYFGPDATIGSGDSQNLINDFSYLNLGIREHAEQAIGELSEASQALLQGYAAGFNTFLNDRASDVPLPCRGQPWVQDITDVDMLTYALGVALLPGAANFVQPLFIATPPGESFQPTPVAATSDDQALPFAINDSLLADTRLPDPNPSELGSNGWAIGSELSASGRGMLLANPHFPHVGNQRFWQFGIEIPGEMKVVGGSLSGFPGLINIGFNQDVAWTHTFSTAQRFLVYQLELDTSDAENLSYLVDGESRQFEQRTFEVEVNNGQGGTVTVQRTMYQSDFGPLIEVPGNFEWGEDFQGQVSAFALHDANLPNFDIIDHWLALNVATSADDIDQAFVDYNGLIFNNIMATDKDGNTFFTDGSSVPLLSDAALDRLLQDPVLLAVRQQAGFFMVPGNGSEFLPQGKVPTDRAPRLRRQDFVQNSNNSYWLTNPNEPLSDRSFLLFGRTNNQQSLRSRMGQKKLSELSSATLEELEALLISNRAYLAEEVLEDLVAQCVAQGNTPVNGVTLAAACQSLADWDGTMNLNQSGAMVFREFAQQFSNNPQWVNPFNPEDPLNTPNTLADNDQVLELLAAAVTSIRDAGLDETQPLSEVQFVERSLPDGTPSGQKLPWAGANNIEGGFNVFRSQGADDGTLLPRHRYATLPGSQLSAEGEGYHITSGSSWMFVMEFTADGPSARGLLTYSQSSDVESPHFLDQTQLYSTEPQLRPIWFDNDDIEANTESELTIQAGGN